MRDKDYYEFLNAAKTGLSEAIIESIVREAKKQGIKKLCLFGSRAKGNFDEKSDIDIAAYGGDINAFRMEIEESVPTLLMFDVVDMNMTSSEELKDVVAKEGLVLYEEI